MPEKVKPTSDPFPHLARGGLARRFVDVAPETKSNVAETKSKTVGETQKRGGARKGAGRKSSSEPWKAAGMSRAAWYRSKKVSAR